MEKRQGRWKRQIKWIKDGAKNFRLSLSLRVSLNYLRFFVINGFLFFGIMGFLYLWLEVKPSKEIVEQKFANWTNVLAMTDLRTVEKAMVRLYDRTAACEKKDTSSNVRVTAGNLRNRETFALPNFNSPST